MYKAKSMGYWNICRQCELKKTDHLLPCVCHFDFSVSLKTNRKYSEAARILIDYADDIEEAIVTLLEGNSWEEALRLIYFHNRTDLLETHLKPSLLEAHISQMSLFDSLRSTYIRHTSRLAVVRETKRQKQTAILHVVECGNSRRSAFSTRMQGRTQDL